MPIVSSRLAAVSGAWALVLLGTASQGCKRQPPPPAPAASGVPSASASASEMTRCRKRPETELVLEVDRPTSKPVRPTGEDGEIEEEDGLLPFGVDIGDAVPTPFGFAVAGIRGAGEAFVAVLGPRASRRLDLGVLHGDAETPAIAAHGESVLVAMRTTDAGGFTIKLGRIAGPDRGAVEWGYELTRLGRSVTSVEIAASAGHGLLVYQGELKRESRLMLGAFTPEQWGAPFEVRPLDVHDVEMPRLLSRPGGFWLSWVRSLPEPKKTLGTAAADPGPPRDPEERELLDPGLRVVEIVKLDERGQPLGAALRVGAPRRQVLLYDAAPLAGGGLLLATRTDSAAPGAEGGAIVLTEVTPDGTLREERVDDDEIGAGNPTLLVDGDGSRTGPWLTVSTPADATRLGLTRGMRTLLQADPLLGRSAVVAVSGGRFLAQRARGSSVVLEALDCSFSADAASAQK